MQRDTSSFFFDTSLGEENKDRVLTRCDVGDSSKFFVRWQSVTFPGTGGYGPGLGAGGVESTKLQKSGTK